MRNAFESVLNAVLVVAAVAIAAVLVHREFSSSAVRSPVASAPPQWVPAWRDVLRSGVAMTNGAAPVTVIEFSDLECPFCKRFHSETFPQVQREFGNKVSLVFVHLPLSSIHRFAAPAARAAECAGQQGRFEAFVSRVFAKQDSLGLRTWSDYAADAGVPDTSRFARCAKNQANPARIDSGLAIANRLGIHGTPGILVNGWLFGNPPAETTLVRTINGLLKGQGPVAKANSGS